ncbi:MAG TPA: hypothetical protein VF115_04900 [Acidimicrobiia bacterium]
MSDWRLLLFPREKREWGEAYLAEFGDAARLSRLIVQAWRLTLQEGDHMKTVVNTVSILNVVTGLTLAVFSQVAMPLSRVIPLVALGLATQGAFTLWVALTKPGAPGWRQILLGGQTLALVAGIIGLFNATVTGLSSKDLEYGPLAIVTLMTVQAATTLYVFAASDERDGNLEHLTD